MISTVASASAETDDVFVVRYTGSYQSFYAVRIVPLILLFALLALLYLDDETRRLIFSRQTPSYKPFSLLEFGFLLAFVAGGLLDLSLTLQRARRGAVALLVTTDGMIGAVFHRTRLLTWSDIEDVAMDGDYLVIRRRPKSLLDKLFAGRGLFDIRVPVHQLDCDAGEIVTATRRLAPGREIGAAPA